MINLETWKPYESRIAAGDPKTNFAIGPVPGSRDRIEVIDLWVSADHGNSGDCAVRIGFGAAALPAAAAAGVVGIIFSDSGLSAGVRRAGIPGMGAPGEKILVTTEDPVSGDVTINMLTRVHQA